MKYGLHLPIMNDPHALIDLAQEGEAAGWAGAFIWDGIWGVDAWVVLTGMAMRTERIRLGPIITPLTRRRPWKVASEVMTLDHISRGRAVLMVGLGAPDTGFDKVGEETDRKIRAKRLDESLEVINGLWSGESFSYTGEHYRLRDVTFAPKPIQQPRVPIWVVGAWPRPKSMERVIRYDGILPEGIETPALLKEMKHYVEAHRTEPMPFDIVLQGITPGDDAPQATAMVQLWAEAGATWWLEAVWERKGVKGMRERIRQGPPAA